MPKRRKRLTPALWFCLAAALGCSGSGLPSTRSGTARAASTGQLKQQISAGQSQVNSLASAVNSASGKVSRLRGSVSTLESQISRIQRDLDAKRAELLKLRSELTAAKTRLARLEAYETRAEAVLSKQLVSTYEAERPDIVSVVLESTGFQDLLERIQFIQKIQKQDAQVVSQVKAARRAVAAQATRLGALEARQQVLTEQVLQQRNRLASDRVSLLRQEIAAESVRSAKASQLASVRGHVTDLQKQLAQIQAAQTAAAHSGSSSSSSSSSSAPAPSSSGSGPVSNAGFAFPLPKGSVSPPGTWSLDQGVDMSAPGNTPEYAVCSGTIVLHGIGGFGPWAPVLHCDSPISGYSYVYYGHAGPADQLAVGAHVGAGQVMSSIGPGIVGISTGPHLEIGFADSSGSPVGGASASAMMSLLQSSY
jgi:peptidoglycan hydrolase CwlO-like protein